ncbi:hypothetical protein DSO57_1017522 [Entomophthora muscae]|uniref:Uncharacterized protein n=1 Tax=Entomophthora muscae TaxID=34485 RepID=A0ACC2T4G3_9FUNG|nr:hypothetical protein DSO57_1017522 [Entomophthora muscae]
MPVNLRAVPTPVKAETHVPSQRPGFYAEDTLILSQAIYLGLFWLGLIILLSPSISFQSFPKQYLKQRWWLIINSTWIWWVIPHHTETASYYPVISFTPKGTKQPSKPTKATKKKPVSSKKATLKPSPKPSPEPSLKKSPTHSTGGEETDGSGTDHSFYNSASDKEPTKKGNYQN